MTLTYNDIQQEIIKFKKDNGKSNYDVGLEFGISQTTVERILKGQEILSRTRQRLEHLIINREVNMEGLTIDKINTLQAENYRLRKELEKANKALLQAENQYNKVVKQNKELQKAYNELEEMYSIGVE